MHILVFLLPRCSWKLQHPEFFKRQQSEIAAAARSDSHLATDLTTSPLQGSRTPANCTALSVSHCTLATSGFLFLQSHKRCNYSTTPQPCCRYTNAVPPSPSLALSCFFLSLITRTSSDLFLTGRSLNVRLEAGICSSELLSGGTESEAAWMKGLLATAVRGKLLKGTRRAREVFQQQKDEVQPTAGLRKDWRRLSPAKMKRSKTEESA